MKNRLPVFDSKMFFYLYNLNIALAIFVILIHRNPPGYLIFLYWTVLFLNFVSLILLMSKNRMKYFGLTFGFNRDRLKRSRR